METISLFIYLFITKPLIHFNIVILKFTAILFSVTRYSPFGTCSYIHTRCMYVCIILYIYVVVSACCRDHSATVVATPTNPRQFPWKYSNDDTVKTASTLYSSPSRSVVTQQVACPLHSWFPRSLTAGVGLVERSRWQHPWPSTAAH